MSKVTVKGVEYDVPETLTLGQTRDVVKAFGNLEPGDQIGMLIGTIWLALSAQDPTVTPEYVLSLDWNEIVFEKDTPQEDDAAVPPAVTVAHDELSGVAV